MARIYIPQKASPIERLGIFVGGGSLVAILSSQVIFLAWISGFVG